MLIFVMLIFVMFPMMVIMGRLGLRAMFDVVRRECHKLLPVAPTAMNDFYCLNRYQHRTVKWRAGRGQYSVHDKWQIIMVGTIFADPVLQHNFVTQLIIQLFGDISTNNSI